MIAHGWTPKKKRKLTVLLAQTAFWIAQKPPLSANGFMQVPRWMAVRTSSARRRKVNATILCTKRRSGSAQCPRAAGSRLTEVFDALFAAAASCGLNADDGEEATRKTLKSGLDDGMKCPHPDLEADQQETSHRAAHWQFVEIPYRCGAGAVAVADQRHPAGNRRRPHGRSVGNV